MLFFWSKRWHQKVLLKLTDLSILKIFTPKLRHQGRGHLLVEKTTILLIWLKLYIFRNILFFKIESWNFQHLLDIQFHKTYKIWAYNNNFYYIFFLWVVSLRWNFLRFHEILNQINANNLSCLFDKQKKNIPKKIYKLSQEWAGYKIKTTSFVYRPNFCVKILAILMHGFMALLLFLHMLTFWGFLSNLHSILDEWAWNQMKRRNYLTCPIHVWRMHLRPLK